MTDYGDKPEAEILKMMAGVADAGGYAYVKWTCPRCGERCTANEANSFYTKGFRHTEKADGGPCGEVYTGPLYGLLVVFSSTKGGDQLEATH